MTPLDIFSKRFEQPDVPGTLDFKGLLTTSSSESQLTDMTTTPA